MAQRHKAVEIKKRFPTSFTSFPHTNRGEVRMDNHRGILAYGKEEIHVSGGVFIVKIAGEGLELRAMTGLELLITGKIRQIELD